MYGLERCAKCGSLHCQGRCLDRATGRTTRMVGHIPEGGAIVVVPNDGVRRVVSRLIIDHRPQHVALRCTVSLPTEVNAWACGDARPVHCDHTIYEQCNEDTQKRMRRLEHTGSYEAIRLADKMAVSS